MTIAESMCVPSPVLLELGLEAPTASADDLIAGAFAVAVYFDQEYPGDTKPANVQLGLSNIAHEVKNVIEHPTSPNGRRELWTELNFHTRYNGLDFTLKET
jgi:hypothetical protein